VGTAHHLTGKASGRNLSNNAPTLKIALISRRYPPLIGGAEKVLSYLAPALAVEGADVTVLTAMPVGRQDVPARETWTPPDGSGTLTVERLPTSSLRFVGTTLYMRNLARRLRAEEFDVVYVSMLKHDAYVAVGVGRERGFPVVLRPEGAGATGDLAWQRWGRFGRRIGERCKQADAFVSISTAITDELIAEGYDSAKIHALPNGVPIPAQPWQPRPDWRDAPHAVFVGRLAPEKGLHTLIDSWPLVLLSFPTARLTLVGEGPERSGLEDRVANLNLGASISLPGVSADPSEILRAADLFVLPSREEGMSIALLEAMALGVPNVATAIPGNQRIVTDGTHGRLVVVDDPSALTRTIIEQWGDLDRAYEMGQEARRRVEDEFSIQSMARKHLELFRMQIKAAPVAQIAPAIVEASAVPTKTQIQVTALTQIAPLMREVVQSPTANFSYELLSGALIWSDELPEFRRMKLIRNWQVIRFVLRFRTTLILGEPHEEYRFIWEQAQKLFPGWPGFDPARRSPALREDFEKLEAEGMEQFGDMEAL
jgi:glycosyltransferase involved in cell wall biosynthesis